MKCNMRLQIKKRYKNTEVTLFENMLHVACLISLLEEYDPCNKYLPQRLNVVLHRSTL